MTRPFLAQALMGGSGAGKTTLMDCIAGRKTIGEITGNIFVNGHPKNQVRSVAVLATVRPVAVLAAVRPVAVLAAVRVVARRGWCATRQHMSLFMR